MQIRSQSLLLALLAAVGGCPKNEKTPEWPPLTPYLAIHDALADDSLDGVKTHGAALHTALAATAGDLASGEDLREGVTLLASEELGAARRGFQKISADVIAYLEQHPEARKGLMIVHCTMAFDNAGASWVQRVGVVENPYEGKNMLHCGDKVAWGER